MTPEASPFGPPPASRLLRPLTRPSRVQPRPTTTPRPIRIRTTHPRFFGGPDGDLVFEYRHGGSGSGDWIYDACDPGTRSWARLPDEPLLQGDEDVSAYKRGPVVGRDGYYHLAWGWRDHPAAQQQHDIYYVRSEDLHEWETSRGGHVGLPIREGGGELVDPAPPWGGTSTVSRGSASITPTG